jgi:hypothetical protein
MAGATNRALKAAGVPKATIKTIRVKAGGRLSLKSALGVAAEHGLDTGKAHEHLARRDAKEAASPKAVAARKAAMLAERQKRVAGSLGGAARGMLAARKTAQADAQRAAEQVKRDPAAVRALAIRQLGSAMLTERRSGAPNAARVVAEQRSRLARLATEVDRAAGASRVGKYKIEKNVTVHVKTADGMTPTKAIVKAGNMAAVRVGKDRYNVVHAPTGAVHSNDLSKNVAISAVRGMASGRAAATISAHAKSGFASTGDAKTDRAIRANFRYHNMVRNRQAAYALNAAREASSASCMAIKSAF